ncbi:MAG: potassium transporter Kup, partial [Mesorhizobium sp.]
TGNMLVTTVLLYVIMSRIWKWQLWLAISLTVVFAFIDVGFFASNIVKVFEGGWASLAVAFTIVLAMWTWIRGSRYLFEKTRRNEIPLDFLAG